MAKFVAKATQIDLELTTLNGEEIKLSVSKIILSAKSVSDIVKQWGTIEDRNDKLKENKEKSEKQKGEEKDPFEIMAIELAMLYDKPKEWWLESFDTASLNDIMKHVAEELAGVKKSSKSSKQS